MTTTTTTSLERLLHDVRAAADGSPDAPARVAMALEPHLGSPDLLSADHLRSDPDRYRTNVVHVADDGSFSLVALVWRPGQHTPVHSHRSWCVVGVHQGVEEERSFRWDGSHLELEAVRRFEVGAVTWLATEDEVHDVTNVGDGLAVSLHVYGLDYRALGSSILETFDLDLPRAA